MKSLKIDKTEILKKFEAYLDNVKDGEDVKFEYKAEADKKMKVVFSPAAYVKMTTLISKQSKEVGWNGIVTRRSDYEFYIEDILVYPQKVTGSTVDSDELEVEKWYKSLPEDDFKRLRFHGHSHVNMGVTPSSTDETMYEKYTEMLNVKTGFYIFMILNKNLANYIKIVDYKTNGVYFKSDVELSVEGIDEWYEESEKQIEEDKKTYYPYQLNNIKKTAPKTTCNKDCARCPKEKQAKCIQEYIDLLGVYD